MEGVNVSTRRQVLQKRRWIIACRSIDQSAALSSGMRSDHKVALQEKGSDGNDKCGRPGWRSAFTFMHSALSVIELVHSVSPWVPIVRVDLLQSPLDPTHGRRTCIASIQSHAWLSVVSISPSHRPEARPSARNIQRENNNNGSYNDQHECERTKSPGTH